MFIHDGVPVKENLSEEIRQRLVTDTINRRDKKTGRVNVYRRVSYYDPQKRYNVVVGSKKIGERDPDTNLVTDILRRQSPQRKAVIDAVQELASRIDTQVTESRQ